MMLSVLLAATVSVSAQGFVLDGREGAMSIEGDAVVYDSTRGGEPDAYRFGGARMRDGADGDFALVAGVAVERLDHWNSFRLTAQSAVGNGWRAVFSRIQRAPGEHLLLAQQFVNGEKTDETSVPFNGCAFSFVLARRGGKVSFAWKGKDGQTNEIAEFETPYVGVTAFSFNFDSAKATQSRVKISAVGLTAERRPPEAHLPFFESGRISCAAIPLAGVKDRAEAEESVRIAPGGRLIYAARAPVTASGWTLEWKSEGRVKIRAIQLGGAETLKLSDNVVWDDVGDAVPDGYAARNRGISPWVLRFHSDLRWPLTHPYTSGLFFFEVSPAGDGEIRFGDFRLACCALHDPKPLEPGVGVTEYPVAGKVGAVEIVHAAGHQPKGAPDDLAGWLYVYADGTTACAYATLRWTCGTRKQDDIEGGINPDMTWFGSPGFDWGEVIYESVNEYGTHWDAWYRWRFVNPHPEKDVAKVQMFRLPGDTREYSVRSVMPVPVKDCTIALVEPAKAVMESGEVTAVNVYEYRADAAGAAKETRTVRAEKSAGVAAQVGEATLKRKGVFAAAATVVATEAEKDVPAGQVTLTAGAARSSRLSLMPPKRGDEKPLHYTMICGGHDPFADYDRMVRCGFDEAKVHMAWKVGPDGGWSADGWDERVEKIARAGMTVALRNTMPQKEFDKELKPLYVYQDGANTELKSNWTHDTSDPFYREKLVDYYAFVGRFAERHTNVVGINANYGQRLPVANPGNDTARRTPSLVWTENRLAEFREWLRERGRNATAVTGPKAILDDAELFADYARWNEGVANALIDDIGAAIRRGSKRPHLTFNVNFHPIENKLSGQTFAEYLRVGMKHGPGSLFHETSERYSLSFVKWLAAARTCGLVYGDECCQNPPSYEQAAMAYMWMGMMQCFESNYCQWWGGRPATENVAQFKAYHRMLQDAEYLPDPVCLALSFETGFRELAATAKVPLHTRTQSHYGLASCLRELNVNPDRYMLDEFPELDVNVRAKLLVDDVTRAMPPAFGDRIERFVRAGGAYLAFLETDELNGHAFLKRFGFTDAELTRTDETPFPTAERQVGAGRVVVLRKGWRFGWDPGRPADYCRAARAKLMELGAFEPLVQSDHPCVSVTPYRAKDGSSLISVINIGCEDRVSQVSLSKSLAGETKPRVLDSGSGRLLAVGESAGRWTVEVAVGRINTTVLKVNAVSAACDFRPGQVSADYERRRAAAYAKMSRAELDEAERAVMRAVCDMALVPPRLEMHPETNRYACRPVASAFHGYAINKRLAEIKMWKFAMNGGACGTKAGRLWRVWMAGEDGPEAYVVGAKSDDLGKTWSEPQFVVDGHFRGDWCHGLALQRSNLFANLWTDPSGRMHLFLCQMTQIYDGRMSLWEYVCDDPDADEIVWSEARYVWHGMPHNKPTVMKDGTWLLPVTLERDVNGLWPDLPRGCGVLISRNGGETWTPGGLVKPDGTEHWCEPAVIELADGRIKMVMRTGVGPMETYSSDAGMSWSKPVSTCDWFRNPVTRFQFMRLRSGCWLLVKNGDDRLSYDDNYGLSGSGRNKLKAYFSPDEGKTWSAPVVLDLRDSVAYPDACELADGSVYVSWEYDRRGQAEICGKVIRPLRKE